MFGTEWSDRLSVDAQWDEQLARLAAAAMTGGQMPSDLQTRINEIGSTIFGNEDATAGFIHAPRDRQSPVFPAIAIEGTSWTVDPLGEESPFDLQQSIVNSAGAVFDWERTVGCIQPSTQDVFAAFEASEFTQPSQVNIPPKEVIAGEAVEYTQQPIATQGEAQGGEGQRPDVTVKTWKKGSSAGRGTKRGRPVSENPADCEVTVKRAEKTTPEQREQRCAAKRAKRAAETPEQCEKRRAADRKAYHTKRAKKTPEQRKQKLATERAKRAEKTAAETPEQREQRLEANRKLDRARRAAETPEQREQRLAAERARRAEKKRVRLAGD